jgi:hypothetical protein
MRESGIVAHRSVACDFSWLTSLAEKKQKITSNWLFFLLVASYAFGM